MKAPPAALTTVRVLAGITWTRFARGRALWVSVFVAILPCLYAVLARGNGSFIGDELFAFESLAMAILAPMFVASSVGEEIEDRTTTYLWSRPVPRWAVLAGKLTALVPLLIAIICASWALAAMAAWSVLPPLQSFLALALGVKATALLATALATLAPRFGMALAICWMLFFDMPVGILPAAVQEVSITHQVRTLSGAWPADGSFLEGFIGIVVIALVWTFVAWRRVRRMEA